MLDFDRIRVKQLSTFSNIIVETDLLNTEFVKDLFSKQSQNYIETVSFIQGLNLISVHNGNIILSNKYAHFLKKLSLSQNREYLIRSFFAGLLTQQSNIFAHSVEEFLSKFKLNHNHYEYQPSTSDNLKFSGIRNLFIDLDIIYYEQQDAKYVTTDYYLALCKNKTYLSADMQRLINEKKELLGRAAELEIIEYEKKRLSNYPGLAAEIKHVALEKVDAGYDIKSFEEKLDSQDNAIYRFIEVKAVSVWDYHFYWTRNEMDKAQQYQEAYWLYLLPVVSKGKFDMAMLKTISNPFNNVCMNGEQWEKQEEVVSFTLKELSAK